MGRITTDVGLVSGIPITETVDQLLALQARPRDLLLARTESKEVTQLALSELAAQLVGLSLSASRIGGASLFGQRSTTSSDEDVITANVTGKPPLGSYQFTALQAVQSHQLLSSSFGSKTTVLGEGSLSFSYGGFIDQDISLDLLNEGNGLNRGYIRITDRGGDEAQIDLRYAQTVDDVLNAINTNDVISVRAEVRGDHFVLVDTSGGSQNLIVEEVGGSTTAASLGLGNLNVAAAEIEGADVLSLFNELGLNYLNDSLGVRFDSFLADLNLTFQNGTDLEVDFRKVAVAGTYASGINDSAQINSHVRITADTSGDEYDGVVVQFIDDASVEKGEETVAYDEENKRLVFRIDEGSTNATDIFLALNDHEELSEIFTAKIPAGSSGFGLVASDQAFVLGGPKATATSPGTNGANAALLFTAVQGGAEFSGVQVVFQNTVTAGNETVVYDDTDPENKQLIFQIAEGETTAADLVELLNNDPTAGAVFTATAPTGAGAGLVSVSDGVTTTGGALIKAVPRVEQQTLGDVVELINEQGAGRVEATLVGDRIQLTDLTTGGGTFTVTSLNDSQVAEDLGLTGAAIGGVITSQRVLGGLKSSLIRGLDGGGNLDPLGQIQITDRSGASAAIDLSGAETIDAVIAAINGVALGVEASVNAARNGIQIVDTTGATASNLVVASLDAETAERLNLAYDGTATTLDSGSLDLQTVGLNTRLAAFNGGGGVARGTLTITDSDGNSGTLDLQSDEIQTVGDVLLEIDRLGLKIDARINDRGDGITLFDTAGGSGTLRVAEGSSTTARDLGLWRTATEVEVEIDEGSGPVTVTRQVIDGSLTKTVEIGEEDTLEDLVQSINNLNAGVTASIFNDGSLVSPYRLTIVSEHAGTAGELRLESTDLDVTFRDVVRPQDALLAFGDTTSNGLGVIASSNTNTFDEVLSGVSITIKKISTDPVTINVGRNDASVGDAVQKFVDDFNTLRDRIDALTSFNETTGETGVLFGDSSLLRVETELANLLSGRLFGAGSIQSLETLGISLEGNGHLSFDRGRLDSQLASNPDAVKEFLTTKDFGLSDRLESVIDQLAAGENSLLINRLESLLRTIEQNNERIETMNERLERSRERLLEEFIRLESNIARIQSGLTALQAIQPLAPL